MRKHHKVENLKFEGQTLFLRINGEEKRFPLHEVSSVLERASDKERNAFEISPSGYGIHWPLLDEDISIDGLLGIVHFPSQKRKVA
ncbi:MAG: DUF2442 domain-containing protein [Pseudomonadota bacterium]|nr:DUF2442 domain-containing protein [Desulfobacterales bacterium]MBU0988790.1 DUF2442 domain-containing protein [Pseudomonadota bacterium]